MKKKQNKRLSIDKIANTYNSRSRACGKCIMRMFNYRLTKFNGIDVCDICNKSFIEGFKKGYKYKTISVKHKETETIKHRGLFHPDSYNSITNNKKYIKY